MGKMEVSQFMGNLNNAVGKVHQNAVNHGWWEKERETPELLCLIHAEVSEALEAYRNHDNDNFREELADIVIRVMDMCGAYEIDLEKEIVDKHNFNVNRPYKHGNKKC